MTDLKSTETSAGAELDTRYRDASLPIAERVEILLAQMTLEEKAGLFFQTMIAAGENGTLSQGDDMFGLPATDEYVAGQLMNHFNVLAMPPTPGSSPSGTTDCRRPRRRPASGIPVTVSTDPRHSYTDNPLSGMLTGSFSVWPETMGLAAVGDEALVERFGDIARQEYTAVGIRVALHPQIDLATEPRWSRALQTFGEDPELAGRHRRDRVGAELVALEAADVGGTETHRRARGPRRRSAGARDQRGSVARSICGCSATRMPTAGYSWRAMSPNRSTSASSRMAARPIVSGQLENGPVSMPASGLSLNE